MKQLLGIVIACAGYSAAALAQPPTDDNYGMPPEGLGAPQPNAMFSAIDTDGDGTITSRELRRAVLALKKLDANKDGKITLAEATFAQVGTAGNAATNNATGAGRFGAGQNTLSGDPRPGGPNLSQYDRNSDGQLSADELPPQLRGMLRGADQNGNGVLEPQELKLIQQRITERVRGQQPLPPGVSVGPQGIQGTTQQP